MSYGGVENTMEELDALIGGTILDVKIQPDGFDGETTVLTVKCRPGLTIVDSVTKKKMTTLEFQIWSDEEGNGPGYVALVGGRS